MSISENLIRVKDALAQAAQAAGRRVDAVTLIAVSKRHSVEAIEAAYLAGQRDFGENYAQELRDKATALAHLPDIRWHFIGNLQTNKVKYVSNAHALMHCIDRLKIAEAFSHRAVANNRETSVLLQVNVGGEIQKSGCSIDEAPQLLAAMEQLDGLAVRGLMTIPPYGVTPEAVRPFFVRLAQLRDALGGKERLPELSMGMSADFKVAVAEGATMVRVGTAIFGRRLPKLD